MSEDAFFTVYGNLPRHGPGSDDCTREALRRLPPLPPHPRVVDLGCGAGAQTLVLAEALRTRVIAVDLHRPFLDQLQARARERGLDALVEIQQQDMGALSLPEASLTSSGPKAPSTTWASVRDCGAGARCSRPAAWLPSPNAPG
ncbi:class I SAM-dependent methyltransferase [Myxococcus sp. MxC21-1]|uniref:class I SAM-dependent methyltransferase n=1 Tax=Myxococcus sp. MxC21-1 TaxID=3041439 RepID=UPI002931E210|nr:class I SAM-dependent methyltransferase [Myxococcus sp. MxC21-1]WNZ62374.1 class I SAM-dependent methyltransferase [Myxococcus sp. MxC21-1]